MSDIPNEDDNSYDEDFMVLESATPHYPNKYSTSSEEDDDNTEENLSAWSETIFMRPQKDFFENDDNLDDISSI